MQFPKDFIWGTATAAHQVEGNNTNSDWWHWEQDKTSKKRFTGEPSGIACDSYNRYEEDFDLAAGISNNAIRISIEWARIEPKEGVWDEKEIQHYKDVLTAARSRGLQTFVTLQHFTKPLWVAKKGGWHNLATPIDFARYAKKCAEEFGDLIDYFITVNEPQVFVLQAYWRGKWAPQKKSRILSLIAQVVYMQAHRMAYDAIKSVGDYPVGIAKNIVSYHPFEAKNGKTRLVDRITTKILYYLNNDFFLKPLSSKLDFIGLNYYFTALVKGFKEHNTDNWVSDLGWWLRPDGLKRILVDLKRYSLPVYITEHGLADAWDHNREKYLKESLQFCLEAIEEGALLKGYFHWSLIDNFEWHIGFWPKFGLVEIDREHNLERKPRPSYYLYKKICETGKID